MSWSWTQAGDIQYVLSDLPTQTRLLSLSLWQSFVQHLSQLWQRVDCGCWIFDVVELALVPRVECKNQERPEDLTFNEAAGNYWHSHNTISPPPVTGLRVTVTRLRVHTHTQTHTHTDTHTHTHSSKPGVQYKPSSSLRMPCMFYCSVFPLFPVWNLSNSSSLGQ